jgi:hypothetical protein
MHRGKKILGTLHQEKGSKNQRAFWKTIDEAPENENYMEHRNLYNS